MRESTIEKAVCKFATDHGCLVMKLAGPNQKGQPDRLFIRDGKVLFIEFKRPGQKPTPLQEKWLRDLRAQDVDAEWCDNADDGKVLIATKLL